MSNSPIIEVYSSPMQGGQLPYFVGKQYGMGWLKKIGRMAFPLLKKVLYDKSPQQPTHRHKKLSRKALKRYRGPQAAPPAKRRRKTINNRRKRSEGTIFQ